MSTPKEQHAAVAQQTGGRETIATGDKQGISKNYKGFVAGVFSGIAKLSGGFDYPPLDIIFQCAWLT